MSKRTVTLKLTSQKDLVTHESSARTFGELKKELPSIKWSGMRVVERTNKTTLQMPDAVLPATDFVLFLVPEKVKSGAASKKSKGLKKLKNIDEASYNDCRSHISFLNNMKDAKLSMAGGVDDLRKVLNEYYAEGKAPINGEDPVAIIEECRVKINSAIDSIIESAKTGVVDSTEYVIKTSVNDLEDELAEIKKSLSL
jgi:hypothetical protein